VVDDKLRPALATAVRATGDLAKGQSLLRLALDVSAGTGKDVAVVTGALSKAFNGNQTALKKLVPGIKLNLKLYERTVNAVRRCSRERC